MTKKRVLVITGVVILLGIGILYFIQTKKSDKTEVSSTTSSNDVDDQKDVLSESSFNKSEHSLDNPESIWVVVNKKRPLSSSFLPSDLVTAPIPLSQSSNSENMKIRNLISAELATLANSAKAAGIELMLVSGYRSYQTQEAVYSNEVQIGGVDKADKISARPGHSEHQTGLGVDLGRIDGYCALVECFGDTPEGKWLADNAFRYGFIIRYPRGKQAVTGYDYEPWHLRYVGRPLAEQLQQSSQTMEEFFGLPNAPSY